MFKPNRIEYQQEPYVFDEVDGKVLVVIEGEVRQGATLLRIGTTHGGNKHEMDSERSVSVSP